ncbi:MAG: acyltransferase [Bacteroidetes bacterium]|nr:acyltransferase [Bacteroidota bacterium]MBS1973837.1 acyltransferase [Bacteroidota bacterium]
MQHSAKYISNLTPLRGMAALLVAIFHFEMAIARFIPAKTTMFFEKSYLMVDLFFIMSGFIMLHVYGDAFKTAISKKSFRQFMVARFARIYPLHFFSLLLLIAVVFFVLPPGDGQAKLIEAPSAIPFNFLLLHAFYTTKMYTWNIPSWSISPEWWSYMLFPFMALFISRKKIVAVVVFLLFIMAAYYSIMYLLPRVNPLYPSAPVAHNINSTYDYGFLRGLAGFMCGMVVYVFYRSAHAKKIFGNDLTGLIILLLLATALHFALNDAIVVVLFALLVLSFAGNESKVHTICNNKALQYLGNISYSIYLMQIFFQVPFSHGYRLPGVTGVGRGKLNIDFGSGLMYCIIYVLLLIALSSLSYYAIEKPCRKYINQNWGNPFEKNKTGPVGAIR